MQQTPFQTEIAQLIVETLNLDIKAQDIAPEQTLFGDDGLALDSIDALELAFAIGKQYDVKIKSGDDNNGRIFASISALAQFVEQERVQA